MFEMYERITHRPHHCEAIYAMISDFAETCMPTREDFMLHCYTNLGHGAYVHNQEEFNLWADDAAAAWEFICEYLDAPLILR